MNPASEEVETEELRKKLEKEVEGLDLALEIVNFKESISKLQKQEHSLQESIEKRESDDLERIEKADDILSEIKEEKERTLCELQEISVRAVSARATNTSLEARMASLKAEETALEAKILPLKEILDSAKAQRINNENKTRESKDLFDNLTAKLASMNPELQKTLLDLEKAKKELASAISLREQAETMIKDRLSEFRKVDEERNLAFVAREASVSKLELWNKDVQTKLRSYKVDLENHYKREFKDLII